MFYTLRLAETKKCHNVSIVIIRFYLFPNLKNNTCLRSIMLSFTFADMPEYAHDHIVPEKDKAETKKEQVAGMFNNIAFRYDLLNRLLSAGLDIQWRKKAIAELKEVKPQIVLDVATGTADVAMLSARILKPQTIVGIDIADAMLDLGRKKIKAEGLDNIIKLENGNGETINYSDNTFDAITVAFGVRNFQHLDKGLQEMYRVMKPGARLVVLEFSRPSNGMMKKLYNWYMKSVTPGIGKLMSGNKQAYDYLNASAQVFPERDEFTDILSTAGFTNTYYKPLTFGICCIYVAGK